MAERRAGVGSMWSPGIVALLGWHSGLCPSARFEGERFDLAHRYLNGWLEGTAAPAMARQGLYMSVPERARADMDPGEWSYWYDGLPAPRDLPGPDGRTVIPAGAARAGGAYEERASHISVWNTTMHEYDYLARHWARFAGSHA